MKCYKCGREWTADADNKSDNNVCPFCQTPLEPLKKNIKDTFRWIVQVNGIEVFRKTKIINNILSDYVHDDEEDRKIIKNALSLGVGDEFYNIIVTTKELTDLGRKKFKKSIHDSGLSTKVCDYLLDVFEYSIAKEITEEIPDITVFLSETGDYAVKLIEYGKERKKVEHLLNEYDFSQLNNRYAPHIIIDHLSKKDADFLINKLEQCCAKAVIVGPSSLKKGLEYYAEDNLYNALMCFRKSVNKGSLAVSNIIGVILSELGKHDLAKAWYSEAAKHGYAPAIVNLNNYNGRSFFGKYNDDHLLRSYTETEFDYLRKISNVKYNYHYSEIRHELFEQYKIVAEQNYAFGQYGLGYMYMNALGVERNIDEALKWLHISANNGCECSQEYLAHIYLEIKDVKQDYKEALKWYTILANKGHGRAQYKLAGMYYNGLGVEVDKKKAFDLYFSSAKRGYSDRQRNVGYIYQNGIGLECDLNEAKRYYAMKANENYPQAACEVGLMYMRGEGVKKDYSKAAFWLNTADRCSINSINVKARKALSEIYEHGGWGVEANDNAARNYSGPIPISKLHSSFKNEFNPFNLYAF